MNERVDVVAIITRLAELMPAAFFVYEARRKPLAVGCRDQIIAKVGNLITPDELNIALGSYVRSDGYLRAMARGGVRIGLDGGSAGAITQQHAAGAAKALAIRLARKAEAAPRPVHSSPAPMSEKPRRLSLRDLKQHALARRA